MIQILITWHNSKEKQNLSVKLIFCLLTAMAVDCNSSMHIKKIETVGLHVFIPCDMLRGPVFF